jgi:hypothetical protein
LQQSIPLTGLQLDGQYVVKGYYVSDAKTTFLKKLGKKFDTSIYRQYGEYQLYNPDLDYYLFGMTVADKPKFSNSQVSAATYSSSVPLYQQVILVDDYLNEMKQTINYMYTTPDDTPTSPDTLLIYSTGSVFTLRSEYVGDVVVTLNGLTLSKNLDYTLSGVILTILGPVTYGDVITIIYTRSSTNTIIADSVELNTPIVSGTTDNQGYNKYYYNTTTSKYEVYTNNEPLDFTNILVVLNGITLLKDIDYYQSTTNKNRIILTGVLMMGDIVTIIYYPKANIIDGITETNNYINWYITTPPQDTNGQFSLEYSTNSNFSPYTVNSLVDYTVGTTNYTSILTLTGTVGTNLYYRVKNTKNAVSICGDPITSSAYSETVKVVIQSNAINSY